MVLMPTYRHHSPVPSFPGWPPPCFFFFSTIGTNGGGGGGAEENEKRKRTKIEIWKMDKENSKFHTTDASYRLHQPTTPCVLRFVDIKRVERCNVEELRLIKVKEEEEMTNECGRAGMHGWHAGVLQLQGSHVQA